MGDFFYSLYTTGSISANRAGGNLKIPIREIKWLLGLVGYICYDKGVFGKNGNISNANNKYQEISDYILNKIICLKSFSQELLSLI